MTFPQYTTEQLMERFTQLSADSSNPQVQYARRIQSDRLLDSYAAELWERTGGWNG